MIKVEIRSSVISRKYLESGAGKKIRRKKRVLLLALSLSLLQMRAVPVIKQFSKRGWVSLIRRIVRLHFVQWETNSPPLLHQSIFSFNSTSHFVQLNYFCLLISSCQFPPPSYTHSPVHPSWCKVHEGASKELGVREALWKYTYLYTWRGKS